MDPVFSMDFTTLLVVGRYVDTITWTSENFFEHMAVIEDASYRNAMLQVLFAQIPRSMDIQPTDIVNVLLGTTSGLVAKTEGSYQEAAREPLSPTSPAPPLL